MPGRRPGGSARHAGGCGGTLPHPGRLFAAHQPWPHAGRCRLAASRLHAAAKSPRTGRFIGWCRILIHDYTLRVYYQDTDAGGIVYHANYLAFAERARTEALRERGIPHTRMTAEHGVMFVVRRMNVDYQRAARLDEVIRIRTRITQVNGASATLLQHFWRDNDSLVVLEVGMGCVRASDGRASRLPAA